MFQQGHCLLYARYLIVLNVQVLYSVVLLQPLQTRQLVSVQPHCLQIREVAKILQDLSIQTPQVDLCDILRVLNVFHRDHFPGVGDNRVFFVVGFRQKELEHLLHLLFEYFITSNMQVQGITGSPVKDMYGLFDPSLSTSQNIQLGEQNSSTMP